MDGFGGGFNPKAGLGQAFGSFGAGVPPQQQQQNRAQQLPQPPISMPPMPMPMPQQQMPIPQQQMGGMPGGDVPAFDLPPMQQIPYNPQPAQPAQQGMDPNLIALLSRLGMGQQQMPQFPQGMRRPPMPPQGMPQGMPPGVMGNPRFGGQPPQMRPEVMDALRLAMQQRMRPQVGTEQDRLRSGLTTDAIMADRIRKGLPIY